MIRCEECSVENPAGARFCMGCGAALPLRCPACGEVVPEGGALLHELWRLGPQDGGAEAAPAQARRGSGPPGSGDGAASGEALDERRTVTVLFADLSGYTAIAETLDPESVKRLLERILQRLGDEVERYGGHVDKFIGDNVMAIFGAPSRTATTPSARCAPASRCRRR